MADTNFIPLQQSICMPEKHIQNHKTKAVILLTGTPATKPKRKAA